MGYKCVVLIKQVPDTKRITGDVMNEDGTVRRSALPAIFNPEDLNALELALQIKDKHGGHIAVVTMGLPGASAILRESLYRGADEAILITDRRCAASDTLATSYILSCAVKKLDYDIVLCGRQAIDGDTAQRNIGNGWQQVKTRLPVLLTVVGDANEPRVAAARKMMKYKKARTPIEVAQEIREANPHAGETEIKELVERRRQELEKTGLLIKQWDLDVVEADLNWCGASGSPTKVHRIQSVVLTAKESKDVKPSRDGISDMIHELIEEKTIA